MMLLTNAVIRFKQGFIFLLLLSLVFLVQSCGFQLRGELDISQDISPLYLQSNSAFGLAREIKQLLASNKIEVTDNISKSNSQLTVLNENRSRRVLSVDSNGRVREYLLTYTVNFSIQFNNGLQSGSKQKNNQPADEPIGIEVGSQQVSESLADAQQNTEEPETISVKRTLLFDQNAVLAVTNESEILYKDMRRDTARLILLKVKARSTETEPTKAESTKVEAVSEPATQSTHMAQ